MDALSVAEALDRILADVTVMPTEQVALTNACGRVLAEDVTATLTQPPFDASAMDGYAVRDDDVTNLPATLTVIGEAAAGHGFQGEIAVGQAVRIFTGAPLPTGANAIVIQENTTREGDQVTVIDGTPNPAHIRHRGLDFSNGEVLMKAGDKLNARTLTLAAAMGHATLPLRRQPRVAILATGDELVMPGEPVGPDQIVCSNPFGLLEMVRSAGAIGTFLGIARDNEHDLRSAMQKARDADILVTIGGASVGDHDLVAPALKAEGMALDFWRVKMRPGKPLLFGRMTNDGKTQRVLGLPGNPTSTLICARIYLVALIAALLGRDADAVTRGEHAQLAEPLPANGPRAHYMRGVICDPSTAPPMVAALNAQDSSMLTPLAGADCLIIRDAHAPKADVNARVVMLKLDF